MRIFYWSAATLFGFTLLAAGLCFVINLVTDDRDWFRRARFWFRWTTVVVLASFNIAIFRHIIGFLLGE